LVIPPSRPDIQFIKLKQKGRPMFNIFAKTFMNATGQSAQRQTGAPSHWRLGERFDNREDAEIEAHLAGRRT
jgi:hypothetical protein